jgi:hypothetical protein
MVAVATIHARIPNNTGIKANVAFHPTEVMSVAERAAAVILALRRATNPDSELWTRHNNQRRSRRLRWTKVTQATASTAR